MGFPRRGGGWLIWSGSTANMITVGPVEPPHSVTFSAAKGPITIDLKTLSVDLHDNQPDEAARAFWNALVTVVGKPPMFPGDLPK
jgi:hypothetical protein